MDSRGSTGTPERVRSAWERCAARGLSRDLDGPREVLPEQDVRQLRELSPLAAHVDVVADVLGVSPDSAEPRLAVLAGPDGTVLWRRGGRSPLRRADGLGFVEGAGWDEHGVGTNAIAQALRHGTAEELRGAEHFALSHGEWDCTSAPVLRPGSGEVLGVIDLSGPRGTATHDTRALVRSAARVVETLLAAQTARPSERSGTSGAAGVPFLELRLLADPAAARVAGGDWFALPTRTAEILALLSLRERGWSAEEMAYALYGDHGTPGTVRTEVHRARRRLGGVIAAGPYRFADPARVTSDVARLRGALERGELDRALCIYRQPLLRSSDLLAIEEWRGELDRVTREAVRRSGDPRMEVRWAHTEMGQTGPGA
ncbi:transcriptional regulator [Kocuria dechangensis]|uniref:Transcriptional regulator n=1 Tax=Kocuria dechangensis TaxID=1176249 RepID=A0A917GVZ6_9MICC|nr:GAF domain-containing protein [Kocuria dechangensis]GGG58889.1 transcriptional regulator [Kocuria dechangensis]